MNLDVFPHDELVPVLRALRGVAEANRSFTDPERDFVQSIAHIHGTAIDANALTPIAAGDLAEIVRDPARRKRVVQLAIVMALVEGEPGDATARAVRALASALDIPEPGVEVLYELSHGHTMMARFEMIRRMRTSMADVPNFPGFFKALVGFAGLGGVDERLAARYHSLEGCAEGTFGKALFSHFRSNAFAFPGERHGLPASFVFHDVGHVLSGYGVDPQGEIQQAAFQAGFRRHDGFLFLLFGVLQFHLGMRLTPVAKGQHGLFDVKRVLYAAARGASCRVDLADVDPFVYADVPLLELRDTLGIPAA